MYSWEVEFLCTRPLPSLFPFINHQTLNWLISWARRFRKMKEGLLPTFFFFFQEFWHLANQPLFLVFDIFISFHAFIPLFLQLTHPVCHVFPSLLIFLFSRIFLSYSRKFLSLFLFISHRFVCRFLLKFL